MTISWMIRKRIRVESIISGDHQMSWNFIPQIYNSLLRIRRKTSCIVLSIHTKKLLGTSSLYMFKTEAGQSRALKYSTEIPHLQLLLIPKKMMIKRQQIKRRTMIRRKRQLIKRRKRMPKKRMKRRTRKMNRKVQLGLGHKVAVYCR